MTTEAVAAALAELRHGVEQAPAEFDAGAAYRAVLSRIVELVDAVAAEVLGHTRTSDAIALNRLSDSVSATLNELRDVFEELYNLGVWDEPQLTGDVVRSLVALLAILVTTLNPGGTPAISTARALGEFLNHSDSPAAAGEALLAQVAREGERLEGGSTRYMELPDGDVKKTFMRYIDHARSKLPPASE